MASDDRSFSNFVVADRPLRSCGVRRFSHGQRQGGGPALGEEMLRQSRRHAEMIERERGCLVVNLARAAPKPGPFCQEPGWEKNNVVFKSDAGGRRHAEVIERRARPGRGWRKGVGRCQRSSDGRKQPRAPLDVLAFDVTAAS